MTGIDLLNALSLEMVMAQKEYFDTLANLTIPVGSEEFEKTRLEYHYADQAYMRARNILDRACLS